MQILNIKSDNVHEMIAETISKCPQLSSCHRHEIKTADGQTMVLFCDTPLFEEEILELRQLTSAELRMILLMKGE